MPYLNLDVLEKKRRINPYFIVLVFFSITIWRQQQISIATSPFPQPKMAKPHFY